MKGRMKGFFTRIWNSLDSSEKKSTFVLTIILEFVFLYNTIGNLLTGYEEWGIADVIVMIVFAIFMYFGIKKGWEKIAAFIAIMVCTILTIPSYFYVADGPSGGSVFYIAVMVVFAALCLSGALRIITLLTIAATTLIIYISYYINPELVTHNTHEASVYDSFFGMLAGAVSLYAMVRIQRNLLAAEAKKAQEETKRAEEANRNQNQFFSSMSHEIRTPINSILGLNELILRQDDASDEIRRDAKNIQGAGRMLLYLVNDILDVSKIEAGKMDIVPVNYNVGSLISEIVNMVWLKAEEKGIKLTVDVDPSIPVQLFGDEVRIRQILINLLNNAVKYTSEGTVSLHMECESRDEEQIILNLSVTDTGIGIKPEAMPYLFDSFKRVDEENNRRIEGTGLGLSIVKRLTELMDGQVAVDSVYGQGSRFTVSLPQKISDAARVGDINIKNYTDGSNKERYMCSFFAPDARVLFVDDNEMNLEVESKLLSETGMTIDTVTSGQRGCELTLSNRYDVIFLDHLMPEMDGIECLSMIRRQGGGLNAQTPVIVLTANAGSENRELYVRSGFDDYLIKPVSGKQLEDMLLKHLPAKKVKRLSNDASSKAMNTAKGYLRKIPIAITTSSMCDLPPAVLDTIAVDVIPYTVHTESGDFWDNVEAVSEELVEYMNSGGHSMRSVPPSKEEYESFFSKEVRKAHHVIHIAMTTSMSEEYNNAFAASQAFENVTVVNSECLSSSMGILVLAASYLVEQNEPYERVVEELLRIKKNIHCSFILSQTDYMLRQNYIRKNTYMLMKSLDIHPALRIKNDRVHIGRIFAGSVKRSFLKYMRYALPLTANPDLNVIFVTYVDLSAEDKEWIEKEIKESFKFENVIFQKASAAISINCGPGTFGLLYMEKDKKAYNFNQYFMSLKKKNDEDMEETNIENEEAYEALDDPSEEMIEEKKWYEDIEKIDGEAALKNSGSEDALKTVLKIFYDSIETKSAEIDGYYASSDWQNFTIKVHALKSSARLIGALELGDQAERMESAGKANDIDYISREYDSLKKEYRKFKEILSKVFPSEDSKEEDALPVADKALIESVYEALSEAAESMDTQAIEDTFDEMKAYAIPDDEKEKFDAVKERFEQFDYDGMLERLRQ